MVFVFIKFCQNRLKSPVKTQFRARNCSCCFTKSLLFFSTFQGHQIWCYTLNRVSQISALSANISCLANLFNESSQDSSTNFLQSFIPVPCFVSYFFYKNKDLFVCCKCGGIVRQTMPMPDDESAKTLQNVCYRLFSGKRPFQPFSFQNISNIIADIFRDAGEHSTESHMRVGPFLPLLVVFLFYFYFLWPFYQV